jgi:hypothetical protein
VTTTHGVVALTGTLTSQNAVDHVKDVARRSLTTPSVYFSNSQRLSKDRQARPRLKDLGESLDRALAD